MRKPTLDELKRKVAQLEAQNKELRALIAAFAFRMSPGWKPIVEVVGCSPRDVAPGR